MLIPTAQNHIRIDSSGMLLQAGKEGKRKIPKPTICCLFPGEENLQ